MDFQAFLASGWSAPRHRLESWVGMHRGEREKYLFPAASMHWLSPRDQTLELGFWVGSRELTRLFTPMRYLRPLGNEDEVTPASLANPLSLSLSKQGQSRNHTFKDLAGEEILETA